MPITSHCVLCTANIIQLDACANTEDLLALAEGSKTVCSVRISANLLDDEDSVLRFEPLTFTLSGFFSPNTI